MIYVIGAGPASLFYLLGLKERDDDGKICVIANKNQSDYIPYKIDKHFAHRANIKYKHGIGGNLNIWGGRIRELSPKLKKYLDELSSLEKQLLIRNISEYLSLSTEQVDYLLNSDDHTAIFTDKSNLINLSTQFFSNLDIINATVLTIDENKRLIKLSDGAEIPYQEKDKIVLCCNFYNNRYLIRCRDQIERYNEHFYISFQVTNRNHDFAKYFYKIGENNGRQKIKRVQTEIGDIELTFAPMTIFEDIFLKFSTKTMRKILHILIHIPAHHALNGWLGRIISFLTRCLYSKHKYLVSCAVDPQYLLNMKLQKRSEHIKISYVECEKTLTEKLATIKSIIKRELEHDKIEFISVSDGNHPIAAQNNSSSHNQVSLLDSGCVGNMIGNPTFSLMVYAYIMGIKDGK